MPPFRRLCSAALAAALTAVLLVPAAAQSPAGAPAAKAVDVTRATLPNGLQIVVLRDTLAPVVSTYMTYLAGADDEPITGLAHAQEHMMFRGSKTLDASQFSATTAVTGGIFNANTENEVTHFFFEVPVQDLDIALNLERSRATGLLDAQQQWDEERGAITQEVTHDNSSAFFRLLEKTVGHVFAGSPYADFGLGTVANFKQIQAPDLKQFYARWYHPNDALYVIAGDVDPQETIAKVKALFGNIPSAPLPARKPVHLEPLLPATYHDNSSDPYVIAYTAYRVPGYDSKDYFASQILNDVLNSERGALVDLRVSGKALQTFAFSQTYPHAGLSLVGSVVPVNSSGESAVRDVQAVLEKYKRTGLPPDLVEAAKRREVAQAEFARNSIDGLAQTWSEALSVEHRTPDDDLAGLEKVSVDDVNRVLRTYYDEKTATVAIATPKAAAGSAFGERAGENNTVVPKENTQLPAFAKDVLASLHVPAQTVHPDLQTLSNGIKLVVVPSQVSKTVVLRGAVRNDPDLQDPPGKEGVEDIADDLFSFGTTTYDRVAFQTELDKIAAGESAGRTFSLDVLTPDFDRGVALLADNELHPAFPAQAFAIVKQQTVAGLSGTIDSPSFKAQLALTDALYPPGYPGRRYATPQSAGSVTLDDVKAYYASVFRPDLTTIVVVGDVTPQQAREAIERSFGAWKADGATPVVDEPAAPPNKPSSATIPATGRVQSQVTLAETMPLTFNDPDYPLLQLANTVLTGGFYASLLFRDVRELHGYAYTIDSSLNASRNQGSFRISYGSDPRNVDNAQRLIVDDLAMLKTKPIETGRLQRAKALVVGELPVSQESYTGLADRLMAYASSGRPLDTDRRYAEAQLNATPASVEAAFAKWIRPTDFVRVVEAPAAP
jgi:zinc protease